MAELYSQYASGVSLGAGTIAGSALGVGGINPIVDRLNSISDTNAIILPAVTTPITPIGAVIAWLKSFTNTPSLPDGWVECDGSTLSDADSVYNGQVLPDLNGDNRFMRGDSASGGTGGSETHSHIAPLSKRDDNIFINEQYGSTSVNTTWTYDSGHSNQTTTATKNASKTSSSSTLPTYYGVVWIMRVK